MAEYNKKWADLFPATIGNQNRPAAGVDNTLQYETDKFPQHIANDPVRYDKMNAVVSQAMSNDERLNEKINKTSDDLAAHNKDPKAHVTGIAGNAATASKLLTPRTISLTGKAAGSTSFDGSSNASINVTSVNADTATKLSAARKINITGNATGAATFDGTSDVSINVNVNESKHAVNADNATHANDVTDAVIRYGVSGTDEKFTAAASGVIGLLKTQTGSNDLTSMNKLRSYIGSVNDGTDWYDVISVRHRNGAGDGQNFGLLMYSGLTNTDSIKYKKQPGSSGWTEERTLLDSSNYNSYAPTKTGGGASGTWGISISGNAASATTATKANTATTANGLSGDLVFPEIGNTNTSRKITWNGSTDGADIYYQTTASDQGNLVLNFRDDANCYLRIAANGEFKSYFSPFNGNFHGNVNGTADSAKVCTGNSASASSVPWSGVTGKPGTYPPSAHNHDSDYPSVTGARASGTWGISITGNAASATNADKVDGYHASDLLRTLGGNRTPVITDIFDRAGTIDMTTMSADDKATHKANINKARNASQNIWNTDTGIAAYGGDYDMANGYKRGSLKLTQSYKNFDKILVVGSNDGANEVITRLYDVWELTYLFSHSYRFMLFYNTGDYWELHGSVRTGTDTDYSLSTDTIWNTQDQNSGIIAIYGIKY